MKCISINQPWATLIVRGYKDIENRTWETNHRGNLFIHASKQYEDDEISQAISSYRLNPDDFPTGAVIGVVDLEDIVTEHSSAWFEGPFGWVLSRPEEVPPTPYRGRPSLFELDTSVIRKSDAVNIADVGV